MKDYRDIPYNPARETLATFVVNILKSLEKSSSAEISPFVAIRAQANHLSASIATYGWYGLVRKEGAVTAALILLQHYLFNEIIEYKQLLLNEKEWRTWEEVYSDVQFIAFGEATKVDAHLGK